MKPNAVGSRRARLGERLRDLRTFRFESGSALARHRPEPPIAGLCGFALNDSDTVWVETLTGEQRIDAPDEVAAYVETFDLALSAAAVDEDAIALIRAAAR